MPMPLLDALGVWAQIKRENSYSLTMGCLLKSLFFLKICCGGIYACWGIDFLIFIVAVPSPMRWTITSQDSPLWDIGRNICIAVIYLLFCSFLLIDSSLCVIYFIHISTRTRVHTHIMIRCTTPFSLMRKIVAIYHSHSGKSIMPARSTITCY